MIPLLVLAILEGILRLSGFGQEYPLFIEPAQKPGYLQPNPDIIQRYFHSPEHAPNVAPDTFLFPQQKPQGVIRIVLMGGSSAAGFPYGRFGAPSGMLQQMLKMRYPTQDIEVISVAMASINSYALRDFAAEVANVEPDAVLIYAGHNEYLGVMGVGSVYAGAGGHWANLVYMTLRDFRLFQLLQHLLISAPEIPEDASGRTVMAQVAKNKNIILDSDAYTAGIEQFTHNMQAVLETFSAHDIPVFLSNIVSNEKHQKPFSSASETTGIEWSADRNFDRAQRLLRNQNYPEALKYFQRARDLDGLRFRAPTDFNPIIENLARNDKVTLVDSEAAIRADTPHGIIGLRHMLEHLHPTARGYYLIAHQFLAALEQSELFSGSVDKTQQQMWELIPLTAVDHHLAQYKVSQLTSDYPFTEEPLGFSLPPINSEEERFAQQQFNGAAWLNQQQSLLSYYQQQQQWRDAAVVAGNLFEALQTNHQAAHAAGQLYRRAQQPELALFHARKAAELAPNNTQYKMNYAQLLAERGDVEASKQQLKAVLDINPDHENAKHYLALMEQRG